MQIVTVNLPSVYIDAIAKMTDKGMYPSRSEAIRVALRDFLKDELEMVEALLFMEEKDKEHMDGEKGTKIDMRRITKGW